MTFPTMLFILVVVLAFVFGMTNGFIDGGGLVSTVITTRALEPMSALLVVAAGEMVGLFLLGQAVTLRLVRDLVLFPEPIVSVQVLGLLVAALLAALAWNTGMWRMAVPSSSSHALVGGLVGATLATYGLHGVAWPVVLRIFIFFGIVPLAGMLVGMLFSKAIYWLGGFITPTSGKIFRTLQIAALWGLAMVHGSNDGQKCLAMMLLAAFALGPTDAIVQPASWPLLLLCGGALALGVIFGSRRIISTLGNRLYRVESLQGFCAETSALLLVGASSLGGYPMSTTHVMSASILGAGIAVRPKSVRWALAGDIGLAWMVTLPVTALLSAGLVWAGKQFYVVP